jgi:hypothetical protein
MAKIDPEPEYDGLYLGNITQDFARIAQVLKEASYQMRKRGFSQYPIFPISKEIIGIGQLLVRIGTAGLEWDYYISFLEEFVQKGLIQDIDYFTTNYKNADEYCCLFVVDSSNEFMNFIYIPFPEEGLEENNLML